MSKKETVKSNLVGNGAMRITIPKCLRDELGWMPGDILEITRKGSNLVVSRCEV